MISSPLNITGANTSQHSWLPWFNRLCTVLLTTTTKSRIWVQLTITHWLIGLNTTHLIIWLQLIRLWEMHCFWYSFCFKLFWTGFVIFKSSIYIRYQLLSGIYYLFPFHRSLSCVLEFLSHSIMVIKTTSKNKTKS